MSHTLRSVALRQLHEDHNGINKTLLRAKQLVYWPELNNELQLFVLKYNKCDRFKNSNIKEPLIPHLVSKLPFEVIKLFRFNKKTARRIILHFRSVFNTHNYPKIIYSDNQPFSSSEFKSFCGVYNIKLITSSPRYSQSNGVTERAVLTAKQMLRKANFKKNRHLRHIA
ncbi:Integrase, catalytic core,Ribonuclease H-like domain [Cinara cedri]|uniref:RNA-directed DNA polymerase n=1 Tax=Cinara cedri TaxID=506608 RepID=A0A5E4MQR2_9HEMI|nr:Integrase, catalytic core,Ribonuclease H-like domain [Cinara cedri]